ncbi:MAG: pre-peptidase C-terminal domain-containing protein, partial [Verrucomicrobiales bacterium]
TASADGDTVTLIRDISDGGSYLIRIRDYSYRIGGQYTVTASYLQVPDPFEPNPDTSLAAAINPDDVLQAHIFPSGDFDYYQVTVPTAGRLNIALTNVPASHRMQIATYNSYLSWTGVYVDASNPGDSISINYDIPAAGTHYLRIRDINSTSSPDEAYTLTTTFSPAPDPFEPNGDVLTAPELTSSPVSAWIFPGGEYDLYRIYTDPGSNLSITADNVPSNLRLQIALYNANGSWISYVEAATEGESITYNYGPASGVYYIRVRDRDGDSNPDETYRLTVTGANLGGEPLPGPSTTETEPNNSLGSATLVTTGPVTGTLSDEDWFAIEITDPAQISFLVETTANDRAVLILYNSSGAAVSSRYTENPGEPSLLVYDIGTPGTYYLRIYDDSGIPSTDPYTLTTSLTTVADPYEPNNSYPESAGIALGLPVQAMTFPAGDSDYFRVETPGPGTLTVSLTGIPANIRGHIAVYDDNHSLLLQRYATNPGTPMETSHQVSSACVRHIRITDLNNNQSSTDPYTLAVTFSPSEDANEPNSAFRDATPLADSNQTSGLIHPLGDHDWFRFNVSTPGTIRLRVTDAAGINPSLYLYNDSGGEMASRHARNTGGHIELEYQITEPDTYYARINDYGSNQSSTSPYLLTIDGADFTTHHPLVDLHPYFSPNPALDGHTVSLSASATDADGSISTYEWTSDIDGLLGTSSTLHLATLTPGVHRISVRCSDDDGNWSGTISQNQIITDTILSEAEYNNTTATAMPVPLDTWITGRAGLPSDLDYFKIQILTRGILHARVDALPPAMRTTISLYNSSGSYITDSTAWNNGEFNDLVRDLTPGFYYVRIRDYFSATHTESWAAHFGFSPAEDRYEPNSVIGEASPLPVNTTISDASICPAGDYDFYQINVPGPGRLTMTLNNCPPDMRTQLGLYNKNFAWLGESYAYNPGEDVTYLFDSDEATTLYLRARDINGGAHPAPYSLTASFVPVSDPYEPNDLTDTAILLPSSTISAWCFAPGDYDHYRVHVTAGQTLAVSVTNTPPAMRPQIVLYSPDHAWITYQDGNNNGDDTHFAYTVPSDGMYIIRIRDINGAGHITPYTLTVTGANIGTEPPFVPASTESEDNGSWSTADDIPLDTNVSAAVDPAADNDYFRFYINSPGVVTVSHTGVHPDVTSEMWIYSPLRAQLGYRRTTNPGEDNSLEIAAPTAGYHVVRIKDYGSNNGSATPATIRVTHLPVIDPYEPNDPWGDASTPASGTISAHLFPGSDVDFYRVFVRESGTLALSLDAVPAENRPRLYLYNASGNQLASYVNTNPGVGGTDVLTATVDPGSYLIRVSDEDGSYSADPYTLRVTGADFSGVPVLDPIGDRSLDETVPHQFTINGTDSTGTAGLSYSATGLPPGAAFDPATHSFTWTPSVGQAGSWPGVRFEVTDGTYTAGETITLTVTALNTPPVLDPIGGRVLLVGQPHSFQINGSDINPGTTLAFSAVGIPSGSTFDPVTRTFTWTPGTYQTGTHTPYFEVTDGQWTDFEVVSMRVISVPETFGQWQSLHFTSAEIADPFVSGEQADADGDGVTNLGEFNADTDPRDPASRLRVTAVSRTPEGSVELTWQGGVHADQIIEFSPDMSAGSWSAVHENAAPTNTEESASLPGPFPDKAFFRVGASR